MVEMQSEGHMAAKKIYAVKSGYKTGIFNNWEECEKSVRGYPKAEYKSFSDREQAEIYLGRKLKEDCKMGNTPEKSEAGGSKLTAYVDGSYEHSEQRYGFGCVFLLPDGRILTENGSGNQPETAALRNVTGEMLGAMYAVTYALKNDFRQLEICYDYEGIEKWVTGVWKCKNPLTQKYAASMRAWGQKIVITFTKVAAHSNVYYNEMADQLAKEAVAQEKEIPKAVREKQENGAAGEDGRNTTGSSSE